MHLITQPFSCCMLAYSTLGELSYWHYVYGTGGVRQLRRKAEEWCGFPMSVYCRHCYCHKENASGSPDLGRDLGSKASLNLALSTDSKFLCHGNRILETWNDSICSSLLWPAWLHHALRATSDWSGSRNKGWCRWQIYCILKWEYIHNSETEIRI